jgi:predicted regulator of Ras-like GTPase activity (Roadblock/LC7/MglB family)
VVVQKMKESIQPKTLAAVTASLMGLGEAMASTAKQGNCQYITVGSEEGIIISISSGKEHILNILTDNQKVISLELLTIAKSTANQLATLIP